MPKPPVPPVGADAQGGQDQQDPIQAARPRSKPIFEPPENPFKLQSDVTWRNAFSPHAEVKDILKNRKKNQRTVQQQQQQKPPQTFSDLFAEQEQPSFKLQSDVTWRNFLTPHAEVKQVLKDRKKHQRKATERHDVFAKDSEIVGRDRSDAFSETAEHKAPRASAASLSEQQPEQDPYKLQSEIRVRNFLTPHKEVREILKNRNQAKKHGHAPRGESTGQRLRNSFKLGFEKASNATSAFVERGKAFAKSLADKFSSDGGGHGFSFFKDLLKKQASEPNIPPEQHFTAQPKVKKFTTEPVNPMAFSAKVPSTSNFLKVPSTSPVKLTMPGDMSGSKAFNPAPVGPNPFKESLKKAS